MPPREVASLEQMTYPSFDTARQSYTAREDHGGILIEPHKPPPTQNNMATIIVPTSEKRIVDGSLRQLQLSTLK
jgi:hypothetical protein